MIDLRITAHRRARPRQRFLAEREGRAMASPDGRTLMRGDLQRSGGCRHCAWLLGQGGPIWTPLADHQWQYSSRPSALIWVLLLVFRAEWSMLGYRLLGAILVNLGYTNGYHRRIASLPAARSPAGGQRSRNSQGGPVSKYLHVPGSVRCQNTSRIPQIIVAVFACPGILVVKTLDVFALIFCVGDAAAVPACGEGRRSSSH